MRQEVLTSTVTRKWFLEWARISFAIIAVALASFLTRPDQNDFSASNEPSRLDEALNPAEIHLDNFFVDLNKKESREIARAK